MGSLKKSINSRKYLVIYIGAVAIFAAVLSLYTFGGINNAGGVEFGWAAALTLLTYLSARFSLPIAPKVKLDVSTVSVFAAVLLLPIPLAVAAGVVGQLAANINLKRPWYNILFNIAEVALRIVVGGIVFHAFNTNPILVGDFGLVSLVLGSLATAFVMYVLNSGIVSGVVSIRMGRPFQQVWLSGRRGDFKAEVALYSLGLVTALIGRDYPWAAPLLVIPCVVIYFALKDRLEKVKLAEKLRQQIEEQKQTQAQLIQSARLASVGILAAGVAHEINNPLFVIGGNVELLLMEPGRHLRSERAIRAMRDIHEMTERMAKIVGNLLNFSRSKDEVESFSLNTAIDEVLNLVERSLISSNITVTRDYQPELPPVVGKRSQVQQVAMNLVLNARDAMLKGGELTISTGMRGNRVVALFTDNGHGIPLEVQEHLFEPFFTTKEPGKGNGLGLYISRRIMEEHKGEIRLVSRNGKGATFTLMFPLAQTGVTESLASRNDNPVPVP